MSNAIKTYKCKIEKKKKHSTETWHKAAIWSLFPFESNYSCWNLTQPTKENFNKRPIIQIMLKVTKIACSHYNNDEFLGTINDYVKGTTSDRPFQTSLFSKPPDFFCIIRENSTVIIYLDKNTLEKAYFWKRDSSLLLGINYLRW